MTISSLIGSIYDVSEWFTANVLGPLKAPFIRKKEGTVGSNIVNSPSNRKRKPMLNIKPLDESPQKRPAKQLRVKEPDNVKPPPSFLVEPTPLKKATPAASSSQEATPPTPANTEKLKVLEDELSKLRSEINRIMGQPASLAKAAPSGGVGTVQFSSQTPTPATFLPPPPPPLLPNPLLSTPIPPPLDLPVSPEKPIAPKIKERVLTKREIAPKHENMSLAEILNGASTANLRKTECPRSPGGTPMVATTKRTTSALDHQDMIAMALKKKFQNVRRMSSPKGKGDFSDSSFDNSFSDFEDTPLRVSYKVINSSEDKEDVEENIEENISGNEGVVGNNIDFTPIIGRISLSPIKGTNNSF
eukprot:TRINITY_DN271_c0_g1_i1.p1 TRINITY_DN271_c0_g1~~TRINITY_DN271_c0_g1_i1.p1  ORF type:complete len:359 (+),score=93.58 TRINITY_DN271_c0_g1_i1:244-1320(+)